MSDRGSARARFHRGRCLGWVLVAVVCGPLCGCGYHVYEQRLAQTVKYFEYLEKVNQNLAPEWRGPGVSIRVPIQFQPISATDTEEGQSRQPEYLDVRLPGLLEAWTCKVHVDGVDGEVPCYMYLLSNQHLLANDEAAAAEFQNEVLRRLFPAIRFPIPEASDWTQETHPRGQAFVEPKEYYAISVTPNMTFYGTFMDFHLYEHVNDNSDMQVTLLFVIPQGVDARSKIYQRIPMCLETLVVSGRETSRRRRGGSSGF